MEGRTITLPAALTAANSKELLRECRRTLYKEPLCLDGSTLTREHLEVTHRTLEGIISPETPRIRVFNKAEICDEARRTELRENYPEAIQVSASENIGMERLKETFKEQLAAWHKKREVHEQKEKERAEAPWKE